MSRPHLWKRIVTAAVLVSICSALCISTNTGAHAANQHFVESRKHKDLSLRQLILSGNGDARVKVIVQTKSASPSLLGGLLDNVGGLLVGVLSNLNIRIVDVEANNVEVLAADPDVTYISLDNLVRSSGHVTNTTGTQQVRAQKSLLGLTAVIGSRIAIRIPQINVNITVDDTFVFIALLLYGGQAAVITGALAGVCAALRISRKARTVAYGGGALASSMLITATALELIFGSTTNLVNNGTSVAIIALCVMGLVQYLVHTVMGATVSALKANESIWRMWSRNFLWISISYVAGAAGAGFIVNSIGTTRFWAFPSAFPSSSSSTSATTATCAK
jgi:hypothetical protein